MRIKCLFLPGRRSGGFTAVELILTVSIIGIFAAVAVPSYQTLIANYRAYDCARQLEADIRLLQRISAAEQSSDYNIYFNITKGYYNIRKKTVVSSVITNKVLRVVRMEKGVLLSGCVFSGAGGNINVLEISSGGRTRSGHIVFSSSSGKQFYVIIAVTGRVRVSDIKP